MSVLFVQQISIHHSRSDVDEKSLRAALKADTAEATVIVVAQRISTVIGADRIVVLDAGRVMWQGPAAEYQG